MSAKQKCQLIGIFFLGGMLVSPLDERRLGRRLMIPSACPASIVRVFHVAHISQTDPSWSEVDKAIWSAIELNLAIISACLPTLRPLFLHIFYGSYSANSNCQRTGGEQVEKMAEGEILEQ